MRSPAIVCAVMVIGVLAVERFGTTHAQTTNQQGAAPAQPGARGATPPRTPLLPTPPLTAAPTPDKDGNFVIGSPYAPAAEVTVKEGVPKGTIHEFAMDSTDSRIYPGIARKQPGVVPYTRRVAVYVPANYAAGTPAPFIVVQDGMSLTYRDNLPPILDNLIHEKRVPADGRGDGAQRRRRRAGQSARTGVRHRVRRLHGVHRNGSAAAHHEGLRRHLHCQIPKDARRWAAALARRVRSRWRGSARISIAACCRIRGLT